jgi:hypothetical protein
MAARNNVLGDLKEPYDPDQQHNDIEAVFRIAEAERGSYGGKGHKPLQTDRRSSDGPQRYRRKCQDRNGEDKQPCDPAEEDLRCQGERFSRLRRACAWLYRANDVLSHVWYNLPYGTRFEVFGKSSWQPTERRSNYSVKTAPQQASASARILANAWRRRDREEHVFPVSPRLDEEQ